MTGTFWIGTAMAVYLLAMVAVGAWASRRSGSSADFYLGGRQLGPLVTAMSAEASDMSSYLLMGLPGLAYFCGLAEVSWTVIGLAAGTWLNWFFVAGRLRRFSARLGAIPVPEFFSRRCGDEKRLISCAAALVILVFFVPYTASGFQAVGTLFHSLFGVSYHGAMLAGALVIIGYTVLGGFLAVSVTDLLQSLIMTAALITVVVFSLRQGGGAQAVLSGTSDLNGFLSLTKNHLMADNTFSAFGGISIVSTLAWGLGYFGMPHILLRFMAIRQEKELRLSRRIASVWVVLSMGVAVCIGVIGRALSQMGKLPLLETSSQAETVIIRIAELLSSSGLVPAILAGVVLAGILAATMSTADSQLLTAASSVSRDLAEQVFGLKLSKKQSMLLARGTVAAVALVAVALAWTPGSSVFRIVSFAWAGFGAAFGPLMLFSLFWRRLNRQGALAGMLSGGACVFLWKFLIRPMGGAWDIYELLPAFLVSAAVIFIVSLLTDPPEQNVTEVFDA